MQLFRAFTSVLAGAVVAAWLPCAIAGSPLNPQAAPQTVQAPAAAPPSAPPATAPAGKPDPVAQRALDQAKIKYEIDKDGDFRIVYSLDDPRTQQVWLSSSVSDYGTLKIREIFSYGYKAKGNLIPIDVANRMLEHNNSTKLGAWSRQGQMGLFVVKISATASSKEVADALSLTAQLADQLEQEFNGDKDEY